MIFSRCGVLAIVSLLQVSSAYAGWSDKMRGFIHFPNSTMTYCSQEFYDVVDEEKSTGASMVSFLVPHYQENLSSSEIFPGTLTPDWDCLNAGIDHVQSRGLDVGVFLHIDITSGGWRKDIDPSDRDAWFANLRSFVVQYARDLSSQNPVVFSVGTEMHDTVSIDHNLLNGPAGGYRWGDLIREVKGRLPSTVVTYSIQHPDSQDDALSIAFDDNEVIPTLRDGAGMPGISAYWPLYAHDKESAMSEFARYEREVIYPFLERWHTDKFLFTEIGYRSCGFAFERPYDAGSECAYNPEAQAIAWDAFLTFFADKSYNGGIPGAWATDNDARLTTYNPLGKPAQDVIARHWSNDDGGDSDDGGDTDSNLCSDVRPGQDTVQDVDHNDWADGDPSCRIDGQRIVNPSDDGGNDDGSGNDSLPPCPADTAPDDNGDGEGWNSSLGQGAAGNCRFDDGDGDNDDNHNSTPAESQRCRSGESTSHSDEYFDNVYWSDSGCWTVGQQSGRQGLWENDNLAVNDDQVSQSDNLSRENSSTSPVYTGVGGLGYFVLMLLTVGVYTRRRYDIL